jgi:hypothetical protein
VRHALRGVGENLQDHLQLRSVVKVEGVRTLNTRRRTGGASLASACNTPSTRAGR